MRKVYEKYKWNTENIAKKHKEYWVKVGEFGNIDVLLHNKQLKKAIKEQEEQTAKEIFADVQEYLDDVDNYLAPFLFSHKIDLKKFGDRWNKLKKKYLGDD